MAKKVTGDENLSVSDLLTKMGTASSSGKSFHTVAGMSCKKSMESSGPNPWENPPMIQVKHRWLKGRSVVANNTIIAFGMDGVARVPNAGNALTDVETYIRSARGLAEIISVEDHVVQPVLATPVPAVVVKPQPAEVLEKIGEIEDIELSDAHEPEAEVAESSSVGEDVVQEPESEDEAQEPVTVKKKTPPRSHHKVK
jgi:hypothetical protein